MLVHSCDIFDGNRITIKLNGFLINFNGWVYDKKLGSHFLRFRCLFLLHENEFSFVAEENSFQLFFRSAFGLCLKVMKASFEKLLKTSDPENVFRNTFTVKLGRSGEIIELNWKRFSYAIPKKNLSELRENLSRVNFISDFSLRRTFGNQP